MLKVLEHCANAEVRAAAAATLGCVSDADVREAVVSCGGVEALLSMLEKGDANGELEAIHAICSLADHNSSHAGLSAGIKSLVALASGDGPSQAEAMATVHKLSAGGEAAARAALACSDAAILLLVKQLSSAEAAERTSAMSSLLQLCDREESRTAIVAAGGVAPLVAVAQARIDLSSSTRREAALVLSSLSTAANTNAVATNGGIGVLIAALELSTLTGDGQMTQAASAALRELVACDAGRSAILSGGVPACVQLLSNESEAVQLDALHVLRKITSDDEGQAAVCSASAAKPLVRCARPEAISILCQLTHQEAERPSLIAAGVVPPLVAQLSESAEAARAVEQLSGADGGPSAIVSAGGIQPLVALIDTSNLHQANAVRTMHNLAQCSETISAVKRDEAAVAANVHVLTQCADPEIRAFAAATLGCVSDAGARAAVVSAGGVEALLSMLDESFGKGDANGERASVHAICSLADYKGSHAGLSAGLTSLVALASGDGPSQAEAMATVHKLSAGGEPAARAALACSDFAIALMVQQLSGDAAERASAMSSLLQLLDNEEARSLMVAAGGIAPLIALAKASDLGSSTRRQAAFALASLSTAANATAVAEGGGVDVLIAALEHSTKDAEMTQAAASALRQLVACDAGRSAILSGGVPACVQLLSNESEAVQLDALHVLQVLTTGDDRDGLNTLSAANAAKPLVQLLSDPHAPSVQHGALCLLHRLASIEKESSLQQIVDAGGAPALLPHLSSKESDARDQSLSTLAKVSPLLTHLAVEFNHISTLSCCFIGGTPTRHEHAASVLSLLASDHANAPTILSTGGAQGLLKVSKISEEECASSWRKQHARVRASNALKQLAAPLFGAFTECMVGSALLNERLFWSETMIKFLSSATAERYPSLTAAPSNFFFELWHLCSMLMLRRTDGSSPDTIELRKASDAIIEVLEAFENEPAALAFFSGVFEDKTFFGDVLRAPVRTSRSLTASVSRIFRTWRARALRCSTA